MIMELIHTSAPRGLKPGTRGFTTVAQTRGMPAWLSEALERMSGYRFAAGTSDTRPVRNPAVYRFARLDRGHESYFVLSRIAPCSADYSGRSNRIAHHLVLDTRHRTGAGPAWLLRQENLFRREWNEEPRVLDPLRRLPDADLRPGPCHAWRQAAGDAGWAGELLRRWLEHPEQPLYLRHPEPWPVLDLLVEATALLPPIVRWRLTFQTAVTGDLPTGITCTLRCLPLLPGGGVTIRGMGPHNTLDLSQPAAPPDSPYARKARTGQEIADETEHRARAARKVAAVGGGGGRAESAVTTGGEDGHAVPYELAPLDDLPPEVWAPRQPSLQGTAYGSSGQRASRRALLAAAAAGAVLVLFAAAIGIRHVWSGSAVSATTPQAADAGSPKPAPPTPSATAIPIGSSPEADRVASADVEPMVAQAGGVEANSPETLVATTQAEDRSKPAVTAKPTEAVEAGSQRSIEPFAQAPVPEGIRWMRRNLNREDIATTRFEPALVVPPGTAVVLSEEWLTDDGRLQIAWLARRDGSPAKVPRWRLEGNTVVRGVLNPLGPALPTDESQPVLRLQAQRDAEGGNRVWVSMRLSADLGFREVSGLCLRHRLSSRARLLVWRGDRPPRIEVQRTAKQRDPGQTESAVEKPFEGRGPVINWTPRQNGQAGNRAWTYERKGQQLNIRLKGGSDDVPAFRVQIEGSPEGACTVRVYVAPDALSKDTTSDAPFLRQLRAALDMAANESATRPAVVLPNLYGVPMTELIFVESREKEETTKPADEEGDAPAPAGAAQR